MDRLNHTLYSYVIVGHICNFNIWRNIYKNLNLTGKKKMRSCKILPEIIKMLEDLKFSFPVFSFLTFPVFSLSFFQIFFDQKLFICIHLSLFIHIVQNNSNLSSSNITYWKSDILLVKVQSALCWRNTRPVSLN